MKVLLILWAFGLASTEKLDRTYLPPPGSITAGGRPGDLDLPLEFPKENYPSTLEPAEYGTIDDGFLKPNLPNVAIGIDRQGPNVPSDVFATGPVAMFSKNTFKVPTSTTSYAFTQSTTLSPVQGFETIGTVSTQFDFNTDYPQQTSTGIIDTTGPGSSQFSISSSQSTGIPYNTPDVQRKQIIQEPSVSQSFPGFGVQLPRTDQPSVTANDFSGTNFPSTQYSGDLDNLSEVSAASTPDEYYDDQRSGSSKPGSVGQTASDIQQYPGDTEIVSFPTSSNMPTSEYASTPKYSSTIDDFSSDYDIRTGPERVQTEADRNAIILNYENILTPEGFAYSFHTSNGIHADESGTAIDGLKAKGSYSYTGDDGKVYSIVYTADENGFLPRGDHLPTAPPIPDAILKVIEQAAKNKQLGIVDNGSYDDAKYGHGRYQGSMSRRPQVHSNNIIGKLPANEEGNNIGLLENSSANIEKDLDQIYIGDERGDPRTGDSYSFGNEKQFGPDNAGPTYNNGISSINNLENINSPLLKGSRQQSPDNSELTEAKSMSFRPDHTANRQQSDKGLPERAYKFNQNNMGSSQNADEFLPSTQVTTIRKGYGQDMNQPSLTGYDYNQPQNKFNDNDENNLKSRFLNMNRKNDEIEPEDKVLNEATTAKPFITPNVSFNFNRRKNDDRLNKRPNINRPFATSEDSAIYTQNGDSDFNQPGTSAININASDNTDNENIVTDKKYSTRKPVYGSTSSGSYNEAPFTSKVISNGRNNYQTPTLRSQYASTTPLPSEASSRLTPTNRVYNSQTTPSSYTTTLRPSTASKMYSTSSRRPTNTGRINDDKKPITRVDSFVKRPTGYRGNSGMANDDRDYKQPTAGSQDLKPRYGSSRPDIGSQTTERIGEDFSGPKQPQRFDPVNGYYY